MQPPSRGSSPVCASVAANGGDYNRQKVWSDAADCSVYLELDDGADRLAAVHQVEGLVDALQRKLVRDQRVDLDLAVHVPVHDLGHLGAATHAAERGALPDAARH